MKNSYKIKHLIIYIINEQRGTDRPEQVSYYD